MKHLLITFGILLVFLLEGCNTNQSTKPGTEKAKNDSILISKTYHSSGGLWKVNRSKKIEVDGKTKYILEGEVLEYYKTPQNALSSRAIYKDGKREGLFIKYYTDGNVYYTINYADGKMNGVKESFHKNGQLMAETPYKNGLIGIGTKEYTPDGKLLAPMELKVWYNKNGNTTTVYAQVLNKGRVTKRVKFYEGLLIEGKYSHNNLQQVPMSGDRAQITIHNTPATVTISAKAKSAHNNYSFLSKTIKIK